MTCMEVDEVDDKRQVDHGAPGGLPFSLDMSELLDKTFDSDSVNDIVVNRVQSQSGAILSDLTGYSL